MRTRHIINIIISLIALLSFTVDSEGKENSRPFTVVIDAGHGGKDIGAADNGAREKDINLGVALQLEKLLKKRMKSANVVMTRTGDTYLTLQERADKANKAKGDLFISIHTNSVDKSNKNRKTVSGSSVYALGLHKDENNMKVARRENSVIELESNFEQKYSGFDPAKDESYIIFEMAQKKNLSKSIKFAEDVQKELVGIGRGNRGVHQAGFWVLWATSMPAVLIELDFICNPGSAKYMTSDKGRKEFAEAICNAVEKYEKSWRKTQAVSPHYVDQEETSSSASVRESSAESAGVSLVMARQSGGASKKKKDTDASLKSSRSDYAAARRRRRSEEGKERSSKRNLETDAIPLHTEGEWSGKVLAVNDNSGKPSTADSKREVKETEKERKKREKEEAKRAKKEKKEREKKKRRANAHNAKVDKIVTVYKIQILASADLLKQNNPRFRGLSPISAYKENNLYKYYYGETTDPDEIEAMLKEVRKKIPDAFVVTGKKSSGSAKK